MGRNHFEKDYIFRKFTINLLAAFLGTTPWCPSQHHLLTVAAAIVIKQFRKATNKLKKKYVNLSATFRNLCMVKK
jgi:hypothetical protein